MVYFAVGILFVVIAVVTGIVTYRSWKDEPDYKHDKVPTGVLIAGLIVALTTFAISVAALSVAFLARVNATEVGIPVTFGKVGSVMQPGMHVVAPWTNVETFPTRPISLDLIGDNAIRSQTKDAGVMTIGVNTRWFVDPEKAATLYLEARTGNDGKITKEIVEPNVLQAVNGLVKTKGNLEFNNTDPNDLEAGIMERLQEQLNVYGINVKDVNIRSVTPDEGVANSISRLASQQQETKIAEEAKKTAAVEADKQKIVAEGQKQSANALAGISNDAAAILCLQTYERVLTAATDKGIVVYTNPCGPSSQLMVNAK